MTRNITRRFNRMLCDGLGNLVLQQMMTKMEEWGNDTTSLSGRNASNPKSHLTVASFIIWYLHFSWITLLGLCAGGNVDSGTLAPKESVVGSSYKPEVIVMTILLILGVPCRLLFGKSSFRGARSLNPHFSNKALSIFSLAYSNILKLSAGTFRSLSRFTLTWVGRL